MSFLLKSVLAEEMNEYLAVLDGAEKDTESYITVFKSLDSYLTESGVTEKSLPEAVVMGWLTGLTMSSRTRNYTIGRVRRFSRYLTAVGVPAFEPDFIRAGSTFIAYTFSDEEFEAIIKVADSGIANAVKSETEHIFPMLFRVLYGCGLRIGEALALRWEDIDFTNGIITILESKNDKERIVPISSSLIGILKLYHGRKFNNGNGTSFLFGNTAKSGLPYIQCTFRYWFLRVLKQANISNERKAHFERCISPHTLRHYFTFKSFMKAEANGDPLEETAPRLSAYLGHNTFFSTEKYLTTDYTMYTDSQQRVAESIESLFPEVCFE